MKNYGLLLATLCCAVTSFGQVFNLTDSVKLPNAQIWGVCADEGDSLCVTTTFTSAGKPHIYMRKINYTTISQAGPLVQLTNNGDFSGITNLTDHKTLIWGNHIYISFSTQGDQDLFLFKTDLNGNRIGNIVTVVSGSADPTNDMILVTDGTYIYVMHFDPPFQHHVYKFDANLNSLGSPVSTTTHMHNNIGQATYLNNTFHLFTGSTFGFNSNLTYTTWNSTWGALSTQNILSCSGGDGNFFSTGAVYDAINQRWYVAMNHINNGQSIGQEHIDLVAFDASFNLLERKHITAPNYTRPHLVLKNGYLYMSYDRPGNGVYLHKYQVQSTTGLDPLMTATQDIQIFPNPFTSETTIHTVTPLENATLTIDNCLGQTVAQRDMIRGQDIQFERGILPPGLYLLRISEGNKLVAQKRISISN